MLKMSKDDSHNLQFIKLEMARPTSQVLATWPAVQWCRYPASAEGQGPWIIFICCMLSLAANLCCPPLPAAAPLQKSRVMERILQFSKPRASPVFSVPAWSQPVHIHVNKIQFTNLTTHIQDNQGIISTVACCHNVIVL